MRRSVGEYFTMAHPPRRANFVNGLMLTAADRCLSSASSRRNYKGCPSSRSPKEPAEPEWLDISGTVPGAAARDRAIAARAAQGRVRNVVAGLLGAKTDERAWRMGADGEQAVADQLAKLSPGGMFSAPYGWGTSGRTSTTSSWSQRGLHDQREAPPA